MAQQVANGNLVKHKKTFMQFVMIFHLLKKGRPMTDFKGCKDLFDFLKMPNNSQKH
jgi:hypothetical protein